MNAAAGHPPKRKRDFSDEGYEDEEPNPTRTENGAIDFSILEALEKQQNPVETLDLKTLKKLVLAFERRLKDNTAARLKYPDQPEKFADSELELHDEIEKLKILAGGPELYPELVSLGTVSSIVELLNHDNTDIAVDVVSLIQDLTDADVFDDDDGEEAAAAATVFVDALIENNGLELLVQNMNRLSESDPDEAAAIYSTLTTIENLIEIKPAVAGLVCERTKLMKWLVSKIKSREFDGNKQYASEMLAILLQDSPENQKRLGAQYNGVDAVLQAVAMYKGRDPRTVEEEEMVENLFDCLCCMLMPLENKERFLKAEGVELMIIIMNQKKLCYGSAIKALDFAMTNYPPACERFIDVMGLKTAFPAFMGKIPLSKKNKKKGLKEELEERLISLMASLFGGLRGSRRDRLLKKFVENECEKIDRLMELYMRYSNRVKTETERMNSIDLDDLEMDEDEKYIRKMESGLYSLQLVAVILGHLWTSENPQMQARIELLLKQNKLSRKDVKDVLLEYHDNVGDLEGPEEKERAQSKIEKFISAFDHA